MIKYKNIGQLCIDAGTGLNTSWCLPIILGFGRKGYCNWMKEYKRLFLVDGDSFIYKALNGIGRLADGDKVLIFVTTDGLRQRLKLKGYIRSNVAVILVQPGPEAVDNRIKSFLGNTINRESRRPIAIISHDHGYYKLINKYRVKYGMSEQDLKLKKSIQAAL